MGDKQGEVLGWGTHTETVGALQEVGGREGGPKCGRRVRGPHEGSGS